MKKLFKKMMREQVQIDVSESSSLAQKPSPRGGWIATIRNALGLSSYQLAKRMKCAQSNVTALERREKAKNISLASLEAAAQAMECRLVYFFVPHQSFDAILENQARRIAKIRLKPINHSMELEQQGLTIQQKKRQEDEMVQELLQGNLRDLWAEES